MRRPSMWPSRAFLLALASAAALLAGCVGRGTVVRVADGQVTSGPFIGTFGYESFLRGALAEEQGDFRGALAAYEATAASDPDDPEVSMRVDRMQRRLANPAATVEADRRFSVESSHAAPASSSADRARLEALTLIHGDRVEAWEALAAWGTAHGDIPLAVRGMLGVVRRAPERRRALGASAVALAGRGYTAEAQELAGALLDADGSDGGAGVAVASMPLVARLALDEALLRHDSSRVETRSTGAHLGLEVAAGRAWIAGDAKLAHALVSSTVKADPSNLAARLVYEGAAGRAGSHLLTAPDADARLPAEISLPFAREVLVTEGAPAARRVLAFGGPVRLPVGDTLLTPLAVELATAGVLSDESLPADGRIELAARRRVSPDAADVAAADERHALLGVALLRPTDTTTSDLARRFAGAAREDPLVAVALVKIALARGEAVPVELRAYLEALAPADAIAAAGVLDIAQHAGPPAALAPARRRLAALARTPGERALAAE